MRRRPFSRVLLAGLALVLAAAAIRFGWIYRTGRETILTSATLKSALDIADLSTAEFQYRGHRRGIRAEPADGSPMPGLLLCDGEGRDRPEQDGGSGHRS
jgi:hypothetical protein